MFFIYESGETFSAHYGPYHCILSTTHPDQLFDLREDRAMNTRIRAYYTERSGTPKAACMRRALPVAFAKKGRADFKIDGWRLGRR